MVPDTASLILCWPTSDSGELLVLFCKAKSTTLLPVTAPLLLAPNFQFLLLQDQQRLVPCHLLQE